MKLLSSFFIVVAISLFAVSFIQASEMTDMTRDLSEQAQKESLVNMISGVVQDVQGDWCVVQDSEGTEWKIQVDNYTDTIGNVLPGATIIAMVEPDGHAKEVKVLSN
jgi:hypothetical protein